MAKYVIDVFYLVLTNEEFAGWKVVSGANRAYEIEVRDGGYKVTNKFIAFNSYDGAREVEADVSVSLVGDRAKPLSFCVCNHNPTITDIRKVEALVDKIVKAVQAYLNV